MSEAESNVLDQRRDGRQKTRGPFLAGVEAAALVLMIGAGLAAWAVGAETKAYDYDEVIRAHAVWLVSRGLRPYLDFFEVHPPYFVLLSPIARAVPDPIDLLRVLRMVGAAGNLLFLTGLAALVALAPSGARSAGARIWGWLGIAFVAFHPSILELLVEFRIDGWGYGLIVWSTVLFCRRRAEGLWGVVAYGAVTAFVSALFAPKTVLLPPLIVLFDQWAHGERLRRVVRAGAAYAAGVALAALAFRLYLLANGIPLERAVLLLGRYHAISNAHAGFGYGLLHQILLRRTLLTIITAGALCWLYTSVRSKRIDNPYIPAVLLWLGLQVVLVSYPYKQYYVPWFLFATLLLAPLGLVLERLLGRARVLLFVTACVVSLFGCGVFARLSARIAGAQAENRLIRWMNSISDPADRVVGYPPFHPIDRYDTFFLSFNTTDPNGFDSARILAEIPGLRRFATADEYWAELEAHPPAFIVVGSKKPDVVHAWNQAHVCDEYVAVHHYQLVRVGGVHFAVRPDCYARARRNGYLR